MRYSMFAISPLLLFLLFVGWTASAQAQLEERVISTPPIQRPNLLTPIQPFNGRRTLKDRTSLQGGIAPNVLFIMSDDHAAHAIGAYGSRLAALNPTPVIDTLAEDGILFENCYCTNSICTPSRACIITGQYSHVNGVFTLGESIAPENQTLAIKFREAGYQTAMIGKWHLKLEPNFDYYRVLPGQGKYHDPEFRDCEAGEWPNNIVQMEGHSSDCITDSMLAWMEQRDRSKPFFMMYHFKAPHDMFENAARYDTYLEDVDIPEPASMWTQPNFGSIAVRGHEDELVPFIGTSIGRRHAFRNYTRNWANDASLSDDEAKRTAYNGYLKRYLRCVKGVDDNLARAFAYLEEEGILDDTVIMYTGDQGFMLGEHDYQDKRWMYDPSQRMPLLVRYPRTIEAGTRTDAIVENVDFGPTMLAFAGIDTPDSMQGESFRSICETTEEPDDWKDVAYYRYWMHLAHHWNPSHFGIRSKDYKLIFYYGCSMQGGNRTPPAWELYDLKNDPEEVNNVYDDPAYADVVTDMKQRLAQRREEIGDVEADFPEIGAIVDEYWDYDDEDVARAIAISHEYAAMNEAKRQGRSSSGSGNRTKPGEYIKPAPSNRPLAELDDLIEISRDAEYMISQPGPANYNPDNAYFLSGEVPRLKQHAFHCPENADKPHVVIRLAESTEISAIRIVNRIGQLNERAAGLTVWISEDGEDWTKIWQAESPDADWTISFSEPVEGRYIKIGLPGRGTLHLNHATFFGTK
jgi:arylsulfatase A-like enzyme